jgi:hypothetical protein
MAKSGGVGGFAIDLEGFDELDTRLAGFDAAYAALVKPALQDAGNLVRDDARAAVPTDRKLLQNAIVAELQSGAAPLSVFVGVLKGPALQYAAAVEKGRRPGAPPPPTKPIEAWARRKGIDAPAYVLARAIGRKGIPARPFLAPAWQRNRAAVKSNLADARDRLVRRLAGG